MKTKTYKRAIDKPENHCHRCGGVFDFVDRNNGNVVKIKVSENWCHRKCPNKK